MSFVSFAERAHVFDMRTSVLLGLGLAFAPAACRNDVPPEQSAPTTQLTWSVDGRTLRGSLPTATQIRLAPAVVDHTTVDSCDAAAGGCALGSEHDACESWVASQQATPVAFVVGYASCDGCDVEVSGATLLVRSATQSAARLSYRLDRKDGKQALGDTLTLTFADPLGITVTRDPWDAPPAEGDVYLAGQELTWCAQPFGASGPIDGVAVAAQVEGIVAQVDQSQGRCPSFGFKVTAPGPGAVTFAAGNLTRRVELHAVDVASIRSLALVPASDVQRPMPIEEREFEDATAATTITLEGSTYHPCEERFIVRFETEDGRIGAATGAKIDGAPQGALGISSDDGQWVHGVYGAGQPPGGTLTVTLGTASASAAVVANCVR
jgi:hypothetical protein